MNKHTGSTARLQRTRRPRTARCSYLLAGLLLPLTGCTATTTGPHDALATQPVPTSTSPGGGDRVFALAGYSPLVAAVPEAPLATAPSSLSHLELEAYLLQRSGRTVQIVFALHNRGTEPAASIATQLGEGINDFTVAGVSVLDPVGLKQYLTLRPAEASQAAQPTTQCACSSTLGLGDIEPDGRRYFATTVTAPPSTVTTVTLLSPVGSLPGLTLTGA